jgi:hypothetical protein
MLKARKRPALQRWQKGWCRTRRLCCLGLFEILFLFELLHLILFQNSICFVNSAIAHHRDGFRGLSRSDLRLPMVALCLRGLF